MEGYRKGLCGACLGTVKKIQGPVCTRCGKPFASEAGEEHLCGVCLEGGQPFQKARSAVFYDGSALEAIHRFKYGGRLTLAHPLGRMTFDAVLRLVDGKNTRTKSSGMDKIHKSLAADTLPEGKTTDFDIVIPVPLHKQRLKERGFNQSLLLASEVARGFDLAVDYRSLKRIRPTRPQVDLKPDERRKNVKGAFEVKRPGRVRGRRVLLVDDVFTTGATVSECARVLKKAGAEVYVLTLARVARL